MKPGVDAAPRTRVAPGHGVDQVLLEPADVLAGGQLVDLGRADAAVDRAGHQGEAGRGGRVLVLGHHGHRCKRRHAGLANRHQVRARAHHREEIDDVVGVLVEAEGACGQRHVACVVPVGDVDIVVGQHGAHGVAQQRGEVARHRRHDQHLGLGFGAGGQFLAEAQQGGEGPDVAGLFGRWARLRPFTSTSGMSKGRRWWVISASVRVLQAAAIRCVTLAAGRPGMQRCQSLSRGAAAWAQLRKGHIRSVLAW